MRSLLVVNTQNYAIENKSTVVNQTDVTVTEIKI